MAFHKLVATSSTGASLLLRRLEGSSSLWSKLPTARSGSSKDFLLGGSDSEAGGADTGNVDVEETRSSTRGQQASQPAVEGQSFAHDPAHETSVVSAALSDEMVRRAVGFHEGSAPQKSKHGARSHREQRPNTSDAREFEHVRTSDNSCGQ